MAHHPTQDDEFEYDGPSKSSRKRDSHALQDIGEALIALSPERLKKMPLPENLLEAVLDWQRFTTHGAKRRQIQYIGKLMRNVDPAPILEALDAIRGVSAAEVARMHHFEQLRQKLLDDEKTLHQIAETWPGADLQHLRVLRRNALKERELQKPPRAFRELYKALRALDAANGDADDVGADADADDVSDRED